MVNKPGTSGQNPATLTDKNATQKSLLRGVPKELIYRFLKVGNRKERGRKTEKWKEETGTQIGADRKGGWCETESLVGMERQVAGVETGKTEYAGRKSL